MAIGYVLITTEPQKEKIVLDYLKKLDEITETTPLFGEYDIIAKLEAEKYSDLGQIVIEKIRKNKYINDTKTLTVIDL